MNADFQLIGKTITGVIATPGDADSPGRIWMLQFSDGSHVEFVSPSARRRLIKAAGSPRNDARPPLSRRGDQGVGVA